MIEEQIDKLLTELRIAYHKSSEERWINYKIATQPTLDLRLDLCLLSDTLNVEFNGCYAMLEQAEFEWRFRANPNAFDEWRIDCLSYIRDILSSDLKIETRWLGNRLLGGYLFRWDGSKWDCYGGGGSVFMFLGGRIEKVYQSWQVREAQKVMPES